MGPSCQVCTAGVFEGAVPGIKYGTGHDVDLLLDFPVFIVWSVAQKWVLFVLGSELSAVDGWWRLDCVGAGLGCRGI